jgi:hypothetical protein
VLTNDIGDLLIAALPIFVILSKEKQHLELQTYFAGFFEQLFAMHSYLSGPAIPNIAKSLSKTLFNGIGPLM